MDLKLRVWMPAMALSFIIGCAGEEGATPAPAPASPAPGTAETPAPPPIQDEVKGDAAAPAAESQKTDAEPSLEGPKASAAKLSDEEIATIKELPAEDQAPALAQAVCPVSDENLGGMGAPIKFTTAEGRSFYLCCKGCEKEAKDDPKAVLAKLDQK